MRYLKLFEAFESIGISKTLKFIEEKTDKSNKVEFLNELKDLIVDVYKFPIDKLTDDDIIYLSAIKAKKISTNGEEISNPYGVYAVKFWFSIKEGYLGKTGVGNVKDTDADLNEDEINKIKEDFDIKTGTLTPIKINKLKNGDIVFGYFSDSESLRYFSKAIIFRENGQVYAIQNVNDGGTPESRDWRNYGRYSWNLGSDDNESSDHSKLHLWEDNSEKLSIITKDNLELEYLINGNGYLSSYTSEISEKSDFALVIYLDPLIKYESVEDVRDWRKEQKKGAAALMSDEEFRKININRYISNFIVKLGLTQNVNTEEIKDLQKIVLKSLCGKWSLITIYKNVPEYESYLNSITIRIKRLIESNDNDKEDRFRVLVDSYKDMIRNCKHYEERFIGSQKKVNEIGNERVVEITNKVIELGEYLNKKISEIKIDNIEDFRIVVYKLKSLSRYMDDESIEFVEGVGAIFRNFQYNDSDVTRGVEYSNRYLSNDDTYNDQLKRLSLIKRYIDSI